MNPARPLALLAFVLFAVPVSAHELACPDLSRAVQIGACPSEEELRYTFTGFCAANERSYRGDTGVCTDFEAYRRLKNHALWESTDGAFSGYVSCDLTPSEVRSASVSSVHGSKQGRITVLACGYTRGISFSHRTRAECRITNPSACPSDAAACRATCE